MNLQQEHKLIQAAQRGDKKAFGQLYDLYVDKVYRYILFRVTSPDIAEDLTSDVYVKVVEGLPSYELRDVSFLAWLYRIAHARVVDHYRQNERRQQSVDFNEIDIASEDDPEKSVSRKLQQDLIKDAMKTLTPEQQQVIILRFTEGYNLQETAERLGKTLAATKVLQFRAVGTLERELRRRGSITSED